MGCQRGDFKSRIVLNLICPAGLRPEINHSIGTRESLDRPLYHAANTLLRAGLRRRDLWLHQASNDTGEASTDLELTEFRQSIMDMLTEITSSLNKQPAAAGLNPLQDCVLAIAREWHQGCGSIANLKPSDSMFPLLCSAAVYQAKSEGVSMILVTLKAHRGAKNSRINSSHNHFSVCVVALRCYGPGSTNHLRKAVMISAIIQAASLNLYQA